MEMRTREVKVMRKGGVIEEMRRGLSDWDGNGWMG